MVKAQSAIEYLMTYGWMLLAVAIIGGGLFSVVSTQEIESISGFEGENVILEDFGVNSQDELEMVLRNGDRDIVNVNSVTLTQGEDQVETTNETRIGIGDTEVVKIEDVIEGQSMNSFDVNIDYGVGGLTNLEASGTITASLELDTTSETGSSSLQAPSNLKFAE